MFISAEISVVLTFGSPKRLNSSSVTSRMRSAVRRGFLGGMVGRILTHYALPTIAAHARRLLPASRQDVPRRAKRVARARRRVVRHRGRRVLRAARPQRRRQDDAHLHPRRPGSRHRRARQRARTRCRGRLCAGAALARHRAAGAGVRSVLLGARDAAHPERLLRRQAQRRVDRRAAAQPRPGRQGGRQHAPALRGHEAARAGRAGARAPPARDRARRADRRRRRGAAPDAVAVHRAPEPRRAHRAADHALPRGSRGAVRAHRHAQAGPRGGAGPHRRAARRHRQHDAQLQDRRCAAAPRSPPMRG